MSTRQISVRRQLASTTAFPALDRRRFLLGAGALGFASLAGLRRARAASLKVEKDELKFGFIKLTDMAPLAVAKELGYFEDEGLFVTLEAQANWKVLLDRVITGELDGAHMLAGQPLAATIGFGTKAHIVTPFSMDLNGNAITVSNAIWEMMKPAIPKGADGKPVHPISAEALKPAIEKLRGEGKPFKMGMVFPVSTHNYELRYWLAAGGVHPGFYSPTDVTGTVQAQALLSVTPPPQMPATLEAGTINGYCVGEPWNQAAVFKGIGVPVIELAMTALSAPTYSGFERISTAFIRLALLFSSSQIAARISALVSASTVFGFFPANSAVMPNTFSGLSFQIW